MPSRRWKFLVVGAAAAVMAFGLGITPAYAVLTVSPNSALPDSANANVQGTGYAANQPGTLMECKFDTVATVDRCKDIGVFTTNASGNFGPVPVTVTRTWVSSDTTNEDCNLPPAGCRVVATLNNVAGSQESAIAFASAGPPPPTPTPSLPAVVATSTSWGLRASLTTGSASTTFAVGTRPLVPFTGDWDGNGTETPATFGSGVLRLYNQIPPETTPTQVTFGDPRGFPVAGDFDGNGTDDVAVFRNGFWQVHHLGAGAPADKTFSFGPVQSWPTVVPVAGDWDGNGVDGIGTFTTATGTWNLRQTASTGPSEIPAFVFWATSGSYPVVGDWDANGADSVGVKRNTTWTLNNQNDISAADVTFDFGAANDLPLTWRQAASST